MKQRISSFDRDNFYLLCRKLARKDKDLKKILDKYGSPPMWTRPNTFSTLLLIILEQQVSLASAAAAYKKLQQKVGTITPAKVLSLADEELKSCYFSRQKAVYARELAKAFVSKEIQPKKLPGLHEDDIRIILKKVKGIGDWTVDVYLLFALQRSDIFPLGDLAMVKAMKRVKGLEDKTPGEKLLEIAETWKPYRSVATMLLWHYYLEEKKMKFK